jgi:hypothetical protein
MTSSENAHHDYDCKITGDLVTTFHSHTLAEAEVVSNESMYDYDIECRY